MATPQTLPAFKSFDEAADWSNRTGQPVLPQLNQQFALPRGANPETPAWGWTQQAQEEIARTPGLDPSGKRAVYAKWQTLAQGRPTIETYDTPPGIEGRGSMGTGALNAFRKGVLGAGNFFRGQVDPSGAQDFSAALEGAVTHDDTALNAIAGGAGSAVAMLPALAAGGPLGMGAAGLAMGAGSGRMEAERRRRQGEDVSGWQEAGLALGYGATEAVSEYIGGKLITSWAPAIGGKIATATGVQTVLKGAAKPFISTSPLVRMASAVGAAGIGEAGEEALAQVGQNFVTQRVMGFTPGAQIPGLAEGIGNAALGGLGGGLAMGPVVAHQANQQLKEEGVKRGLESDLFRLVKGPKNERTKLAAKYLAGAVDRKVVWFESPLAANGFFDDRNIYLNSASGDGAVVGAIAHEALAHIANSPTSDPQVQLDLASFQEENVNAIEAAKQTYLQILDHAGMGSQAEAVRNAPDLLQQEGVGLLIEKALGTEQARDELAARYPGLFGRISQAAGDLIDRIGGGSRGRKRVVESLSEVMGLARRDIGIGRHGVAAERAAMESMKGETLQPEQGPATREQMEADEATKRRVFAEALQAGKSFDLAAKLAQQAVAPPAREPLAVDQFTPPAEEPMVSPETRRQQTFRQAEEEVGQEMHRRRRETVERIDADNAAINEATQGLHERMGKRAEWVRRRDEDEQERLAEIDATARLAAQRREAMAQDTPYEQVRQQALEAVPEPPAAQQPAAVEAPEGRVPLRDTAEQQRRRGAEALEEERSLLREDQDAETRLARRKWLAERKAGQAEQAPAAEPEVVAYRRYSSDDDIEGFMRDLRKRVAKGTALDRKAYRLLKDNFSEAVGDQYKPLLDEEAARGDKAAQRAVDLLKEAGLYWEPIQPGPQASPPQEQVAVKQAEPQSPEYQGSAAPSDEQRPSLPRSYRDPTVQVNEKGRIASDYDRDGETLAREIKDWSRPIGDIRYSISGVGLKDVEWDYPYQSEMGRSINGRLKKETERLLNLGIRLPLHRVELPKGNKGKKVPTGDIVYPSDAMQAITDWIKTPEFQRVVDPGTDHEQMAREIHGRASKRKEFVRMAAAVRRLYHAVDKAPRNKSDILIVGENGKAGGHMAYGLITCHPSSNCAVCYAAGDRYVGVLDRGVVNAIVTMAKPEAFGRRIAEEVRMRDPDKTLMPFFRLLGAGDMTSIQQVQAFNAISENLDRPIHIFSRHHDLLGQLKSSQNAPFVKMASVDAQLFNHYGLEALVKNHKEKGILTAYLLAREEDIDNVKALHDANALGLFLPASESIYKKALARYPDLAGIACPCDADLRPFNLSCVECALSRLGCFMAANELGVDLKGKTWVLTDDQAPDLTPVLKLPTGPELDKTWIRTAARLVDASINNIKGDIQRYNKRKREGKSPSYMVLRDLRFPRDITKVSDPLAAEVYIETLAKVKSKISETGTFVIPGVETIPTIAYRNGVRLPNAEAARIRTDADAAGTDATRERAAEMRYWRDQTNPNVRYSVAGPGNREVESPGFKKWKAGATVAGGAWRTHEFRTGEPVTVTAYHGTNREFTEFKLSGERDTGFYGRGFYFSPEPSMAQAYIGTSRPPGNSNIMPVHVRFRNPYVAERGQMRAEFGNQGGDQIRQSLEARGHDGAIILTEDGGNRSYAEYVSFKANNIKGKFNKGDYSEETGDIRYSVAGVRDGDPIPETPMHDPPSFRYSVRLAPPPQRTVKAYKLFRVREDRPGKLFPLFVKADRPVEMGVWHDAEEGDRAADGKVKSKLGPLAYRPGWHGGDLPLATHIGGKAEKRLRKPTFRPDNQVWAEVEMANDVNWQEEANKRGWLNGKWAPSRAAITDGIPRDGFYRYKTNPNMTGNWLISGAMKVNRILSDQEVEEVNRRAGTADLPRLKPFDAAAYGFEGGTKYSVGMRQTDTPEFKAWFGDSKVVDKDGKPLVVYHGTSGSEPIESFDTANGAFFTDSAKLAGEYTSRRGMWQSRPTGSVYPAYLSMQNPLIIDALGSRHDNLPVPWQQWKPKVFGNLPKNAVSVKDALEYARTHGHDGLIVRNVIDTPTTDGKTKSTVYAVVNPTQIKSATGNRGTFDPNDPDIRYSVSSRLAGAASAVANLKRGAPTQGVNFALTDESVWNWLGRKVVDEFSPVRRMQEDIKSQGGTVTEATDVAMLAENFPGRAAEQLRQLRDRFQTPVVDLIDKGKFTLEEVGQYLIAQHAEERNDYIAGINPNQPDGGSGMKTQDARNLLSKWAADPRGADMARIADLVVEMNRQSLDLLEREGLIDPGLAGAWRKYDRYVPLRDDMEEEGFWGNVKRGKGYTVAGKESKRALGRNEGNLPDNPLFFSFIQAQERIVRAEKNRVGKAMLGLVRANPDEDLWTINDYPMKQVLVKVPDPNDPTGKRKIDTVRMAPDPLFQTAENVVPVKEGGQAYLIEFKGEAGMRIAKAMKKMGTSNLGALGQVLHKAMRTYSMLQTSLNPDFILPNLLRDIQTAGVNLTAEQSRGMALKMLKGVPQAWKAVYDIGGDRKAGAGRKYHDAMREYLEAGGKIDAYHIADFEEVGKTLEQEIAEKNPTPAMRARMGLRAGFKFIDRLNGATETASRLAAFVAAREAGMTPTAAANLARNLTVNFNRKGEWGTVINTLYMFANASIQGNARLFKALAKSKTGRGIAGGVFGMGLVYGLMAPGLFGEDDEGRDKYDAIPDGIRNTNILLPAGESYAKVPLPYGVNAVFSAGRLLGEVLGGRREPGSAGANLIVAAADTFNPLGSEGTLLQTISPTLTDPLVQQGENKDWAGREIKPQQNPFGPPKPESQLARRDTGGVYKAIAEWLNEATGGDEVKPGSVDISPAILEHWVGWATGGTGRFASKAVESARAVAKGEAPASSQLPIASRFAGDIPPDAVLDNREFRKALAAGEDAVSDLKHYEETGQADKARALLESGGKDLAFRRWADDLRRRVSELRDRADAGDERAKADAEQAVGEFVKAYRKGELPRRWAVENELYLLESRNRVYNAALRKYQTTRSESDRRAIAASRMPQGERSRLARLRSINRLVERLEDRVSAGAMPSDRAASQIEKLLSRA